MRGSASRRAVPSFLPIRTAMAITLSCVVCAVELIAATAQPVGASTTVIATVTVGSKPEAIGINASNDTIYIANHTSASVTPIKGVTATSPLAITDGDPTSIAVDSVNNKVFIGSTTKYVAIITGSTVSEVSVDAYLSVPLVAVDPTTHIAYAMSPGADSELVTDGYYDIITATSGTLISDKTNGALDDLALAVDTNTVYCLRAKAATGGTSSQLQYFNGTSTTAKKLTDKKATVMAVDPTNKKVYLAGTETSHGSITVVTGSALTTVSLGTTSSATERAIAVNPTNGKVYVANGTGTVYVVTGSSSSPITVGSKPDAIAVDAKTDKIYVANETSGTVSVITGGTGSVSATITVGSKPDAIAVDPATTKIYVSNETSGTVSVITGGTGSGGTPSPTHNWTAMALGSGLAKSTGQPGAPSTVTATCVTGTHDYTVKVTWSAVTNASTYRVFILKGTTTVVPTGEQVTAPTLTYTTPNLDTLTHGGASTSYAFEVTADIHKWASTKSVETTPKIEIAEGGHDCQTA